MKVDARITILGDKDFVEIKIEDRTSSRTFVTVKLTASQFVQAALGRLSAQRCECEVSNLDCVGKKMEMDKIRFEMPKCDYRDRDETAKRLATEKCPDGWVPDKFFGSQDSFYSDGNKEMAQCTIRRWVDAPEYESEASDDQ